MNCNFSLCQLHRILRTLESTRIVSKVRIWSDVTKSDLIKVESDQAVSRLWIQSHYPKGEGSELTGIFKGKCALASQPNNEGPKYIHR